MSDQLETERLVMRPFSLDDVPVVFPYFHDPEVMRYIPTGPDATVEVTRRRIEQYGAHQAKYGFSKWCVIEKATGETIGDAGLLLLEDGPDFEVGWRFVPSRWGRGYATEVARAWLDAGFARHGLKRIVAICHPDHAASRRVMEEKVGMTFERRGRHYGMETVLYARVR
jgi:[ribosomal protein S5]-alanine N-acetyltransferase